MAKVLIICVSNEATLRSFQVWFRLFYQQNLKYFSSDRNEIALFWRNDPHLNNIEV